MPEKTKKEDEFENETCENKDAGNWSEDQKNRSYYYDDSYGYEIYNPDEDDEDGDESSN